MLAKKKLSVLMLSVAFSSAAWAGLGGVVVKSNLGEPLRAEIELSGSDGEVQRVGLAALDTFRELKVDYAPLLSSLRFTLAQRANGRPYIRVTSLAPISEPYLRFVVEAKMSSSRSVREYTVLLDPVDYALPSSPAPAAVRPQGERLTPAPAPRLPAAPRAEREAATRAVPERISVQPGQTLYQLATSLALPNVSPRQVMAALLEANPQAFVAGNPDQLRAGVRLTVPPLSQIRALGRERSNSILAAGRARQAAAMSVRAVPLVPQPCAPLDRALLVYCSLMALALLAVMGVAVLASLVSFWPYNLTLTFRNYQFDLMDGGGWASYANSLTMAVATAAVGALLSFLSAYLVARPTGWGRARQWLHAVATLPMAVPGLALGLGYILFFNAGSNPLHFLYGSMGILVLCTVAHFFSVAHITQLTALQQLDAEYERVADSMGLPFWTLLWRVHLPVCLPAVMQVAGYFFVNAMTTVSAVVFLYSPETTLASVAVLAMDDAGDIAPAAAMATLIFATAAAGRLLIALLDAWLQRRTQHWRQR